jgi:hypothetical protein
MCEKGTALSLVLQMLAVAAVAVLNVLRSDAPLGLLQPLPPPDG